jgi:hypothetical protein
MKRQLLKSTLAFIFFCLAAAPVIAGSGNNDQTYLPAEDLVVLAKKVEKYAAKRGARVFLLARVGRPLEDLPKGIRYTHVSYAVYSMIKTKDGRTLPGYAIHNLYQREDDPARSDLVVDYPVDFLSGAHAARVGVIIPTPAMQKRLYEVITSDSSAKLHNPSYSAIANPYNARYQNCTEYVLDVLNAAIYRTDDIKQLKANTRAYFHAQEVKINPLKLYLGVIFKPEVRISDQHGKVETTTFGSLVKYMQENGLADSVGEVKL